ncbi:MAG: DUF4352 domain-containing protein [archaeon]
MKSKIALFAGLLIISLILSGCIDTKEESPVIAPDFGDDLAVENQSGSTLYRNETQPKTEVPTALNLQIGETAKTSKIEVTILATDLADSYDYTDWMEQPAVQQAPLGKQYLLAFAQIKSVNQDSIYASAGDFSATDSQGYSYNADDASNFPYLKELYKNQKVDGTLIFEIPKNAKDLKILFNFGSMFTETKLASWEIKQEPPEEWQPGVMEIEIPPFQALFLMDNYYLTFQDSNWGAWNGPMTLIEQNTANKPSTICNKIETGDLNYLSCEVRLIKGLPISVHEEITVYFTLNPVNWNNRIELPNLRYYEEHYQKFNQLEIVSIKVGNHRNWVN